MSEQNKNTPLLTAENITKVFTDTPCSAPILNGVSLNVEFGEFICILGPSGCGKTTLLRCLAGFEEHQGTIRLNGEVCTRPGADRMMVFQNFDQLFHWKTVKENVMFPLSRCGIKDKKQREAIAEEYLSKVNLSDYGDYYPHQLSGGMKQRVAIAKALALKPRLILMDEPFASLDAMTRRTLQKELLDVKEKEQITVLFVTHSIQEAITLSTRVVVLSDHGTIFLDEQNPLPKPVTPAHPGYAELWDRYNKAIGFG